MIRRLGALLLIVWLLGLAWFVTALPRPAPPIPTDAIVVLTGGPGRIARGLALMEAGLARRMLISGVDPSVRPAELADVQHASPKIFECCVDLGKMAVDTRSNAEETAAWVRKHKYRQIRLVTTDWHMPRARFELERALGGKAQILSDAVASEPSLGVLFLEYNKMILRRAAALTGI